MPAPKLDAPKLPVQICAGRVGSIGEVKEATSGHYYNQTIKIKGVQGSPDVTVWFLWRPEFFKGGLKDFIAALPLKEDAPEGELSRGSAEFVYAKNVCGDDMATLQAIAGSDAAFNTLYDAIAATDLSKEAVRQTLVDFFTEDQPVFYFTRKQQYENADGEKRRKNQYEVGRYFYADDAKTMKYYRGKEKSAPEEYEFTFDPELPFD